ncbi:amino acid carrier protein [Brachybacterium sp. J144]|uniref:alanine/glycine:cation symporter family protein n=1 Tax=Brachybacterium sp. J144 TaxID=3116487 RepID=UPI002E7A74A3|nr:amino acid carrier protein [Brachybacterium sp. J144]MEE1649762.1 amino acid carrier protein [Brachybacterium sp. J144]
MSGIDAVVETIFGPIAAVLSAVVFYEAPIFGGVPIIVVWLMAGAVFLTVWLRFQPITGLKHSIGVIRGRYTAKTDPGQVSSFQALATELSGTVGLGNIAGVAIAITVGGPGAALWIAIFGFFSMSVKMAEATLGVMYRTINPDGTTEGGPMHYLRDGLAQIGRKRLGRVLAVMYAIFALFGVFGAGNLFQANQVAAIVASSTGSDFLGANQWLIGAVMAVVTAMVVLGGVKKIAQWTSAITPAMAVLYVACTLAIIVLNIGALPGAISTIVTSAFTADGVTGGIVGVAVVGIQRALFSNGGGIGTAGMAHSASKTKEPATEGFTALWEPLIDSIGVCMLTALAVVITGAYREGGEDGVALTASAFATVADWFPVLLTVAVVLFGFSTILAYAYYGELSAKYLFGSSALVQNGFRIAWVLAVVVGAAISLDSVIAFSDAMFFLMSIPNLLGIYFLARTLRLEILRHKYRVSVGALTEVEPALQVGMGDHEPTAEQVAAEERLTLTEELRLAELHRQLAEDPDFPVRADHHDDDLASPMGETDYEGWGEEPDPEGEARTPAPAGT